jgi:predicted Zn finger-like uncharacterized protein
MAIKQIFWATCPECSNDFLVDSSLRHAGIKLICPFCSHHFLPDDAAKLDERHA